MAPHASRAAEGAHACVQGRGARARCAENPPAHMCCCALARTCVRARRDVRTREVGIQDIHQRVRPDEVELVRRDYAANKGWEVRGVETMVSLPLMVVLMEMVVMWSWCAPRGAANKGWEVRGGCMVMVMVAWACRCMLHGAPARAVCVTHIVYACVRADLPVL